MSILERRQDGTGWTFPLQGAAVEAVNVDFAVTLLVHGGYAFRVEQPFLYIKPEDRGEQWIVPDGDPVCVAPVLALARGTVASADAYDDGHLELFFTDGSIITVPTAEDYEPWQATGPDGLKVVSVPGGELSVWQPCDS